MPKRILLTGNLGYIGQVMTRVLNERGYSVIGLDVDYYSGCNFYSSTSSPMHQITKDIRNIDASDLKGMDAVVHLAALSNDPLGDIAPVLTENINQSASVNLAKLAKKMGVPRFIFTSSCSLYGISSDDRPLTEEGKLNPITAYAKSKVLAEKGISELSGKDFHPTFMRCSTAYGLSPRLRLDLVVNNLVAWAYLTGEVSIMSDGKPWRPIIHVEDFCAAFVAVLEAPENEVHNEIFNVGINEENYQVKDIANTVAKIVPNSTLKILNKIGSDERSYRVDFSKIKNKLAEFKPAWNLKKGIVQLHDAYKQYKLTKQDFDSDKYFRVRKIKSLMAQRNLDRELIWQTKG